MAFIDGTVVNVAIPALQNAFRADITDVQWVIESYALLLSALILVGGALGDHYGRRLVFLTGIAVFALASAMCGFSQSIRQLVIARSIQGIGAALMVPGSLAIISASFDERSRGKAIGTWSGFTAITTALGPVLGGWLIQHASWRWAFFINVPIAAVVVLISVWHVPESRSHSVKNVDLIGTLVVVLGLGGVVNGFVESANLGRAHPAVLASLIVGFASLILFVWVEAREPEPMVPLALFRSKAFSGANLLTLFLYAALSVFFFLYPMYLIEVRGYATAAAAAAALPMIVLMSSLSRWSGGLVDRYGARTPLVVGPLITAAGYVIFGVVSSGSYWMSFFPGFLILGFGMTITVAPLTTVVMNSVDQDRAGTASGINNAVSRIAGVLAIAVLGVVMASAFRYRLDRSLASLSLPAGALNEIHSNITKLAALKVPAGLDANVEAGVRSAISAAFVFVFRLVIFAGGLLAVVSGVVAWRMIPGQKKQDN
jgi:EmrB/QacA subfamily drug resistance transporter